VRLVSDVLALVAESAVVLKQFDDALARYRRAVEIDPSNPNALEPLIGLCQDRGALAEAARAAGLLARQLSDPRNRGQKFIEAGLLFHDAASALADGAETLAGENEAELRKAAFENLRLGLELLEEHNIAALDRAQLEVAFRATAPHDPPTALRCLDRLLLQPDLGRERRHDLLLEGVGIALQGESVDVAERFAKSARDLQPHSSAAVLAQAQVLEASGRVDDVEALVEGYFASLGKRAKVQDAGTRIALLLRLAEIQRTRPEKAIAAYEHALEVDNGALGPSDRRVLGELYEQVGARGARVLANHVELLALEPLAVRSLAALAEHHASRREHDRAYALYSILALVDPDSPVASGYLAQATITGAAVTELQLVGVVPNLPPDAGIHEALLQLWDGGAGIMSEYLPRVDVPAEARISPLGEGVIAPLWGEALKRLGMTKVALVAGHALASDVDTTDDPAKAWLDIRCQQPPIIIARAAALASTDTEALRFALARGLWYTRPEAIFAMGLPRASLAHLLSAMLLAFHPRHGRRKHYQKADEYVARLGQDLLRKLPMKVSRQLVNLFKEHENESFESPAWRAWVRRAGNRVGLAIAGDLGAAIRVVTGTTDTPAGFDLIRRVREDDDLRDLIAFCASSAYAAARRQLGHEVHGPAPDDED
jgi:tetratricopeptide (TPR) repeat protein